MEPRSVQYVTTPDGYNLAYAETGQGEPLVFLPLGFTHLELVWRHDKRISAWLEHLAGHFRLIQHDGRGQGMSTRGLGPGHQLDDRVLDLETVVDRLGVDRFVLLGYFYTAHVAVHYATKHPERVKALVLVTCSAAMSAWPLDSLLGLADRNFEAMMQNWVPGSFTPEERAELFDYFQASMTREDWLASIRAWAVSDVTDLLPRLTAPTLVLHPRDFVLLGAQESIKVAALIPNARFALIDGALPLGEVSQGMQAIERFLSDAGVAPSQPEPPTSTQLVDATSPTAPPPKPYVPGLSERQLQVLLMLAEGKTNKEIAECLVLSLRTVERHVADIYARLDVRNRAEATAVALQSLKP